ncbi:MAG: quinoprotein dehydrogenase-associated SoxYZ-like carrier [Pseudolabrys sp.]
MRIVSRVLCMAGCLAMLASMSPTQAAEQANEDPWPALAAQLFKNRPLLDGAGVLSIDMPARAEDAAIVPLSLHRTLAATDGRQVKAITVVIDENPSPVAAVFTFGDRASVSALSTRVRVNSYTNVHAVAELSDGKLYVVKTFVKAAGGCSAPAVKDAAEANAGLGEMRFRTFPAADKAASGPREAQIMIRHPNNSGLQMDQITHLYIPAFFVDDLKVWQGDDLVVGMQGGISIAQNPSLRFTYVPNGANVRVEAHDTENHDFKGTWPATGM